MSKPIHDKAEVSIDFADKFYHGSFSRSSQYDVSVDEEGIHITLDRRVGEKRHVAFHLQHFLFTDILYAIAENLGEVQLQPSQRERLIEAAERLKRAVTQKDENDASAS